MHSLLVAVGAHFQFDMKIATWNINSIRVRISTLLQWLKDIHPDIVLLQETKTLDQGFPFEPIEDLGYNIVHHGQKSYNGVAILSKYPFDEINKVLPGANPDLEARYLEAVIGSTRVISLYVPNGQAVNSSKYRYKLEFFQRLQMHMQRLIQYNEKLIIGGDFNVAPTDNDVYNPAAWEGAVLVSPAERQCFFKLIELGLIDAWPIKHGNQKGYTWWDYRMGAFKKDYGLRIDHFLLSQQAAADLETIEVARNIRAFERPSDHAPLWCKFK